MKITSLTLTNFRSFKESQTIEFAPLTLLFGPNSVGKSTVLMALAYVQHILDKDNCDPQALDVNGSKTSGGFQSLVHGQNLKSTMKIRIDFSTGRTPFVHYDSNVDEMSNHIQSAIYLLLHDFGGGTEDVSLEFEIVWSFRFKRAYVKNYRIWVNGSYVGRIEASDDLKSTYIQELHTEHPLVVPFDQEEWLEREYGDENEREKVPIRQDDYHTEFESIVNYLNPSRGSSAAVIDSESLAGFNFENRISPISLACGNGAVPLLGTPVITNLNGQEFDNLDDHFNFLVIRQLLSQAFVLPLDKLLHFLKKSAQIGPLRLVPDSNFEPNPHPEQTDWANGTAAWDLLHRDPGSNEETKRLIRETSELFSSEDKLNTGYGVSNLSLSEVSKLNEAPQTMFTKRYIFFKETHTGILLLANQLGTGISQVLPVVVAASCNGVELVTVEQPELHIHPRLQVELADLFIEKRNDRSFLIETHSEHLVLRLLRRIREKESINGDEVSIVYLSPSPEGTKAKRLEITPDGDFVSDWPDGFFDERDGELF